MPVSPAKTCISTCILGSGGCGWFMDCLGSLRMSVYPSAELFVPVLYGLFLLVVSKAVEHDLGPETALVSCKC